MKLLNKKLIITNFSKINVNKLPKSPGVYLLFNKEKKVIYIGKSNKLKKRVITYLSPSNSIKTKKMIQEIRSFSYILVNSELEALLLEAKLISKYLPFYNITHRDDKNPLYIKITKEKYPKVLTARKFEREDTNLSFFGPFTSSGNVNAVLAMLRKIFPYSDHKLGRKPCLYSQLGLCMPCPNIIDATADSKKRDDLTKRYLKNINIVNKVLQGKIKSVRNNLERSMINYSKNLEFENAAVVRSQIEKLDYITQPIIPIRYFLKNPNLLRDIRKKEKDNLSQLLTKHIKIKNSLSRIECYDVAHLAGSKPTASMVTFIEGEPEKKLYRHFRIKQKSKKDDIASLSEIGKRRIRYLSSWGVPDLIIVDGGKTQASCFFDIFSKKGIPVVGIAKKNEVLVIPSKKGGQISYIQIKMSSGAALNLVQRLRNEAHRFARRYHHKLLHKSLFT